jgi:hypothetical protein
MTKIKRIQVLSSILLYSEKKVWYISRNQTCCCIHVVFGIKESD